MKGSLPALPRASEEKIMKTRTRTLFLAVLGAIGLALSGSSTAANLFVLPTPANTALLPQKVTESVYQDAQGVWRPAYLMNGVPIALKYDDYWSYSAPLLDAIQTQNPTWLPVTTFGTYDFTVGTGTIAVNLTSGSGGATNVDPNGSGVTFQDPVYAPSNDTVKGWTGVWGGNEQIFTVEPASAQSYVSPAADERGTSTIGEMLTYLHTLDPDANVPVFYADYNQTGSADALWLSAKVEIWDSTQTVLKGEWDLDRTADNSLEIGDATFNYGLLNFYGTVSDCLAAGPYDIFTGTGCAGVTANGDEYLSLDHNKGSGKPDFLVYAPDMNLADPKYLASDLFIFTVNVGHIPGGNACIDNPATTNKVEEVGCNTNGSEEFGIAGAVAYLPPPPPIPEPGPLALISLGLTALAWSRRQRHPR
jgi:hypothetical protein